MVHQAMAPKGLPEHGAEIPFVSMTKVTREQLVEYADASGDTNPIHLDDEIARKFGLSGVIAHGMLTAAVIAERAQRWAREELGQGWHLIRYQPRFRAMVFPGDELHVGGVVTHVSDREVVLELKCRNQKDEANTLATVSFSHHWDPV